MGGPGSGKGLAYIKKTTVEECYVLGMRQWTLAQTLRVGVHRHGTLSLSPAKTGENIAPILSLKYFLNTRNLDRPQLQILYMSPQTGTLIRSDIDLQITYLHNGGLHWWLSCPLIKNGSLCGRRVAKLHLPPSKQFFGCRQCYNLAHRSTQQNRKFDRYIELSGYVPRRR